MLKIFTTTGMCSLFISGMLVITVFCAGCSEEVTPSAQVQIPGNYRKPGKICGGRYHRKECNLHGSLFCYPGV